VGATEGATGRCSATSPFLGGPSGTKMLPMPARAAPKARAINVGASACFRAGSVCIEAATPNSEEEAPDDADRGSSDSQIERRCGGGIGDKNRTPDMIPIQRLVTRSRAFAPFRTIVEPMTTRQFLAPWRIKKIEGVYVTVSHQAISSHVMMMRNRAG
jgi:hypothetical protein